MTPADRAKAEKLFRMLQSPNENERSVANRKLIELLAKYNMTISDLIAQGLDGGTPQSPKASTQSSAPRPPPPPPRPPPISIPQHHIELLVKYLVAGFETDWAIDLRPN